MATDAATWAPQDFPSGGGRALTLIRDPCPHGLLELQSYTAIFDVRHVQAKCTFFLSSRFWQGCSCPHKPAGPGCAHIPNRFLVHRYCRPILAEQGRLWSPSLPPRACPCPNTSQIGCRNWFRTVVLLRALPSPAPSQNKRERPIYIYIYIYYIHYIQCGF